MKKFTFDTVYQRKKTRRGLRGRTVSQYREYAPMTIEATAYDTAVKKLATFVKANFGFKLKDKEYKLRGVEL